MNAHGNVEGVVTIRTKHSLSRTRSQRLGFRGDGVLVAMVDTGQFNRRFFPAHHSNAAARGD